MSTSQWNNIKEDSTSTQQSSKFNLPKKSILKHTISNGLDSVSNSSHSIVSDHNDHDLTSFSQTSFDKTNRTVSFAPDVTLHSFEFVINNNRNSFHNATTTTTTENGSILLTPVKINPIHEMPNQEKDEDSMSMELTGSVNISNNINVNENDNKHDTSIDTIEKEERMSPIPLSIDMQEDNFDSTNDTPMELTEVFNPNDKHSSDTMSFTRIPFINVSNDDAGEMDLTQISKHISNKLAESEENPMDFTQTYNKNNSNLNKNVSLNSITDSQNEEMDFTQIKIKESVQEKLDNNENDMELTQPYHSNSNKTNIEHANENSQPSTENEMELTQVKSHNSYQNFIPKNRININHNNDSESDSEMDLTNISSHFLNNKMNNDNNIHYNNIATTNNASNKESKRLRKDDSAEDQTYISKRSLHEKPISVSNAEQMSPIKFNEIDDNNIKSNSNGSPSKSYSLVQFLTDIESHFLQDISNMKVDAQPVSINLTDKKILGLKDNKLCALVSLYSDIPWLQMITFMSKELIMMNEKSQNVLNNLQTQISNSKSPPLLLKRFYDSTDNERTNMKEKLNIIKLYSSLEAKKSWYKWQLSNLENVKIILNENISLLKSTLLKIDQKLNEYEILYKKIISLKESLKNDIWTYKNSVDSNLKEVSLDNKIKLAKLKRYMEVHQANIKELPKLINKRQQLSVDVMKLNETLNKLKQNYQKDNTNEYQQERLYYFNLRDKLSLWGNITGIHFVRITNDKITLKLPFSPLEINLEIQLKDNCGTFISNISKFIEDKFVRILLVTHFKNKYDLQQPVVNILHLVLTDIKIVFPVIQEFYFLQKIFVTHLKKHTNKTNQYLIELKQVHFESNLLILYQIPLSDFKSFICGTSDHLNIYVSSQGKETIDSNELKTLFSIKTQHVIPLLNKDGITLIQDTVPY